MKSICITGASAGIGAACAHLFANSNYKLYLGARRVDELRKIADTYPSAPIEVIHLDVSDDESVKAFCLQTLESCQGKIDVLINNAGFALGVDPLAEGSITDWQKVIDVNVTGVLRITREFLPQMRQNEDGHLVFLSSIAAHQVYPGGAVYCATKHAVRALAEALKWELNGTGLRVSTLDPGLVNTEFSTVRHRGDRSKADATYNGMNPLTAEDIAECAKFIIERPKHVNIDQMIIMPTDQASVHKVHRRF